LEKFYQRLLTFINRTDRLKLEFLGNIGDKAGKNADP
jgi:hypothetical protein